jgi:hypothetical protein
MEDNYGGLRPPLRDRLSLVTGGIHERARRAGLQGDTAPPSERVRAGALSVLAAWAAFVVAGASFAKLSEHFDNALPGGIDNPVPPGGTHHVPDLAYTLVQNLGALGAIAVLVGAGLAVPAFVRFARAGGWSTLRGHVLRAAVSSAIGAGAFVPLVLWSHHLTNHQRNGGLPGYTALFSVCAGLFAVSVVLCTVAVIAAARRIGFSRQLLAAEAALAIVATLAMIVITAATGVWWASIASHAPRFLAPSGAPPVNAQIAGTVALMLLAGAVATAGSARILQGWRELAHA